MKIIAFFNNKGGVGKTSLAYHLAWMYSNLGLSVVAADLDPQANLTAMFLDEERLEELWPDGNHSQTILGTVQPILKGTGDIAKPHVEPIDDRLGLVVGDIGLARFEAKLSSSWPGCADGDEASFRAVSSFYRVIQHAGAIRNADVALVDVGPNLGAINRSAILSAEHIVIPLAADLFSIMGLKNVGPSLREWREEWSTRLKKRPSDTELELPEGLMRPAGYVVLQHAVRLDRPVQAYAKWMAKIPGFFRMEVLDEVDPGIEDVMKDQHCLAMLKNYRSLMPLAQDARKPMFHLKAGDGALGSHLNAVRDCYRDFEALARKLAESVSLNLG